MKSERWGRIPTRPRWRDHGSNDVYQPCTVQRGPLAHARNIFQVIATTCAEAIFDLLSFIAVPPPLRPHVILASAP